MSLGYVKKLTSILGTVFLGIASLAALEPNDVIINEVYFFPKGPIDPEHCETVELLVVADKVNLNGLQLSDRDIWKEPSESQVTVQDMGQGFLNSVRSGTLIVIYRREGIDDTDGSDFVIRLHARSSLFCNTAPSTNSFELSNHDDNLHLLHQGKQIDYVRYRASNPSPKERSFAQPGALEWENGSQGFIPIGKLQDNVGIRFVGNKPELNNFPAAWVAYPEPYIKRNNIGKPNGAANTVWIEQLRDKARAMEVK